MLNIYLNFLHKSRFQIPAVIITLMTAFCTPLLAQDSGFGIGVILGEPTGLSAKNWLTKSTALDFAAAWSFKGENSITLHTDYIVHFNKTTVEEVGDFSFYYGIGGRIKFDERDTRLGARIPIGVAHFFESIPLDTFIEIVPILELLPSTEINFSAALGVRIFFH